MSRVLDLAARWCNVPPVLPPCVRKSCPKCHHHRIYDAKDYRSTGGGECGYICWICTADWRRDLAERQAIQPGGMSCVGDESTQACVNGVRWQSVKTSTASLSRWMYHGECRDDV